MHKFVPWIISGVTLFCVIIVVSLLLLPSKNSTNHNFSVLSNTNVPTTTSEIKYSNWKKYYDPKSGIEFSYPPYESSRVDTTNDNDLSTSVMFNNFAISIFQKNKNESIDEWFRKKVDINSILIKSGMYAHQPYNGLSSIVRKNINIPEDFQSALNEYGPIYNTIYIESPSQDFVFSFLVGPNENIQSSESIESYGYNDIQKEKYQFQEDVLSTLVFNVSSTQNN